MLPVSFRIWNGVAMNLACLSVLVHVAVLFAADNASRVLVRVNGKPITAGDVEFAAINQQVKPDDRAAREPQLVERLIERQLVRDFLAGRKITAPPDDVEFQIQHAKSVLKKHGEDPDAFLAKLGFTPERLKSELSLPLAWQVYVRQTVTTPQIRDYFDKHRAEVDGTQVCARQIFLKVPTGAADADLAMKTKQLKDLRDQIVSGKLSFTDAAKKYSEAPTADQGGDVGRFGYHGKLPAAVADAAFALKVNDVSQPVVSPFGVHLIQVTERHPGDLSLEDVRPEILEQLAAQLWKETIERERRTAKIEYVK